MWNWILANKEWVFSGVGVVFAAALVGLAFSYFNARRAQQQSTSNVSEVAIPTQKPAPKQSDFELLPLSFDISLQQEIPRIVIWLYAVNYRNKQLIFDSLLVTHFHLSGGPTLENIDTAGEVRVPPRNSTQILLRRPLVDSEVRAIERTQTRNPSNASFSVIGKAYAGRKQYSFDSASLSINGWVSGIGRES